MNKKDEITLAKKRRALLLREFNRSDVSISKFAEVNGMSRQRMWKLLRMAKLEKNI